MKSCRVNASHGNSRCQLVETLSFLKLTHGLEIVTHTKGKVASQRQSGSAGQG